MAVADDVIAVGAPDDGTDRSGEVLIYRRSAGQWAHVQTLAAPTSTSAGFFGSALALHEDVLFVSEPGAQMVHVYEDGMGGWAYRGGLVPEDSTARAFGAAVASDGRSLVVGAPSDDQTGLNAGAVYVFGKNGAGAWALDAKLLPTASARAHMGSSVAVAGGIVVAGAPLDDAAGPSTGAAVVFERVGGVWQQTARLTAPDGAALDEFGHSIATDGSAIAVGAPRHADLRGRVGHVYIHVRDDDGWALASRVVAPDGESGARFGGVMAMAGGTLVVGAHPQDLATPVTTEIVEHDGSLAGGTIYLYQGSGAAWGLTTKMIDGELDGGGTLGWSVATDGMTIVAGSPSRSRVYVFEALVGAATGASVAPGDPVAVTSCAEGGIPVLRLEVCSERRAGPDPLRSDPVCALEGASRPGSFRVSWDGALPRPVSGGWAEHDLVCEEDGHDVASQQVTLQDGWSARVIVDEHDPWGHCTPTVCVVEVHPEVCAEDVCRENEVIVDLE